MESASGPAIAPQLVTALLLLSLAALVLAGVAALVRWLWRSRSRIRLPEEDDDDGLVRQRLGRRGLLSRLGQRLRVRAFLLRYAGTPRAALLELERWGARRRCRRQSQETPREYLERLAGGPLRDALDTPMQAQIQPSWWTMWSGACTARFRPASPGSRCGSCSPLSIEAPARLLHVRSDRRPVRASRNARDSR